MAIKISDINKQNSLSSLTLRENSKTPKNIQSEFASQLNNLKGDALHEKLNDLLSQIYAQSKIVEKKFHLSEILKYKKLVKEFLNIAVNNSHKFSKENFLDRRGRHRLMSIIKCVDDELENLTRDFLKKENSNLKVLKRLDAIRGLLIDIFM
ncbi:MAG: uncharacterized protein PWQ37_2541 [Candidatus Petromonas sp.]|jgi:uncharacterized protein YaaR (DUF327 family)|nr:uncharacterized protein [Candidatus Petromonas sp.]